MVRLPSFSSSEVCLRELGMRRGLIVDDVSQMRIIIDHTMKKMGLETLHAADGAAGLMLLQHYPVDVVVTDIEMPGGSGLDLLSDIRKNPSSRIRDLPVIVTSSMPDHRVQQYVRGIDDAYFLPKPISVHQLRVMLQMFATSGWLRSHPCDTQWCRKPLTSW